MSRFLIIHLPSAHHIHHPSRIHYFIPGSKLTFSTNLLCHSLVARTHVPDCLFGLYWTGLILLNGFHFLLFLFLIFIFGGCAVDYTA